MPGSGRLNALVTVNEIITDIGGTGTLVYEGTIISVQPPAGTVGAVATTATIVGGVFVKSSKLRIIEGGGIVGVASDTASITGARILKIGKSLGTVTGTHIGTAVADTNWLLVQMFLGTLASSQPDAGSAIHGSIVAELQGV